MLESCRGQLLIISLTLRRIALAAAAACGLLVWAVPASAKSDQVSLEGTILVAHADNFRQDLATYSYTLRTRHGAVKLAFKGEGPVGIGDSRVVVHGTRTGKTVHVPYGGVRVVTEARKLASHENASGTQKLAVFLLNFQNDTRQPWTVDFVRQKYFTAPDSMAAYYKEQSFGKVTITGDVLGWYTLPTSSANNCDPNGWAVMAQNAAITAGVDLNQYTQYQYVFGPGAPCGWAGLAYVPGTTSWINGTINLRVISHEYGHNLGVHHASSMSCRDTNGNPVALAVNNLCGISEYGDPFDPMGVGDTPHMNNFHKAQYGWFGPGNMVTATSNGTFTLAPIEQASSGIQVLRVPRVSYSGQYFYLEYRQRFSIFDTFQPTDPVVNGVTVRIAPDLGTISQSYLIDTTPFTPSFADSPLRINDLVIDPVSGITFQTLSLSPSGATVSVQFGGTPARRGS